MPLGFGPFLEPTGIEVTGFPHVFSGPTHSKLVPAGRKTLIDTIMISEKAATVLATIGTVCWCVQLIPQIWYNWRRKNCEGFPPIMMFLWAFCGIPFSIYFISTRANIVVQIQPQLFYVFCLIAWVQTLYYPPVQMNRKKIFIIVTSFVLFSAAMEGGFISFLRNLHDKGTTWPTLIFGVLASVCLAAGLVPPYIELSKRQGRVVGIHFLFLAVDLSGALFSALSVVFGNMDVMGIILYCVCAAMEIGIFTSHFIWLCRFRWFGNGPESDDEEKSIVPTEENVTVMTIEGEEDKSSETKRATANTDQEISTETVKGDAQSTHSKTNSEITTTA